MQQLKLNEQPLALSSSLEIRDLTDGTRLLKQTEKVTYLALTPTQKQIISAFDGTVTVQQVLEQLLTQKTRPNIREFYDLVIHARQKQILVPAGEYSEKPSKERALKAVNWPFGWHLGPVFALFLLFVPSGFWTLMLTELALPVSLSGWLIVLLLLICMLSISNLLSASVLHGYGCKVYDPDIEVRYLLPFFNINKCDSFMGGRMCQTAVALQQMMVPFAFAVVSYVANSSAGMFAAGIAAFLFTSPFGHTPGHNLIHALFRKSYELPRCAATFLGRRVLKHILGRRNQAAEEEYLVVYSTYALIWLGSVMLFGAGLMRRQGYELLKTFLYSNDWDLRLLALLVLLFLLVVLFAPLGYQLWLIGRNVFTLVAPKLFRAEARIRQKPGTERPEHDTLVEFLKQTLLFSDVDRTTVSSVLDAMDFVKVKKNTTIVRQGDEGDTMFVIFAGKVQVRKEDETGRSKNVAVLKEGDVFGEVALLEKVPRTASVRALEDVGLLMLRQHDFEQLLLPQIGATAIRQRIQISAFLKRNDIFSAWSDNSLYEIAHHFTFFPVSEGEVVIQAGQQAQAFYLIYEGEFEVIKDAQRLAVLKSGDFFGEISLLKGIETVADVKALSNSVCLRLEKDKFHTFISTDLHTGIRIEDTVENRLPT